LMNLQNPKNSVLWMLKSGTLSCNDVKRAGGSGLLSYYNGSHIKALVRLYPKLMLKTGNFLQFNK